MLHRPYLIEDNKKVGYSFCCTDTAIFACGQDDVHHDIDSFGIGISIYFKILKSFLICFLIITIINTPIYLSYFFSNTTKDSLGLRDVLYKFSLGTMGSGKFFD